jgi:hypothetical protein
MCSKSIAAPGETSDPPDSTQATVGQCDRDCLIGLVDQYLAALVANDPSCLRLTETVKYTENTATIPLGDGLWG